MRHNIATEKQVDTQNAEAKRHNVATEKQARQGFKTQIRAARIAAAGSARSAKISAKASKYNAKVSAKASKSNAKTAAAASRANARTAAEAQKSSAKYSADTNASTAKYTAKLDSNTKRRVQNSINKLNRWSTKKNIKSAEDRNRLDNDTKIAMNVATLLQKDSELDQKTKIELKKLQTQLEVAKQKNDTEREIAIVNNLVNVLLKLPTVKMK